MKLEINIKQDTWKLLVKLSKKSYPALITFSEESPENEEIGCELLEFIKELQDISHNSEHNDNYHGNKLIKMK